MFQRYKILHIPTGLYVAFAHAINDTEGLYYLSECPKLFDACSIDVYYNKKSLIVWDILYRTSSEHRTMTQASKNEFLIMEE